LEQFLDKDDVVEVMTDYIVDKLGSEFPDLTRNDIENFTSQAWDHGQKFEVSGGDMAPRIDPKVLSFFNRLNNLDYGKLFNNQREVFSESIKSVLDGKQSRPQALKALKQKLNVDLTDKHITGRIDDIFRNKIYTTQNFSRVVRMKQVGITEVEVVATMDSNTSPICRELNGRIFRVEDMVSFVETFLSTPVDENFWNQYPQPTAQDIRDMATMPSSDIMKSPKLSVKMPPFHFKCRTTVVTRTKTRIERTSGSGNTTPLKGQVTKPVKEPKFEARRNRQRENEISALTKDELLNKVANLQGNAFWDKENLDNHYNKRKTQPGGNVFGKDSAEYAKKAVDVLKNFNMLYTYRYQEKGTDRLVPKFGFMQEKKGGEKWFVAISPESFQIDSLFLLEDDKYTDKYLRIL
jgi:SPP1 gp7 family putative phage head morphogenesis protein